MIAETATTLTAVGGLLGAIGAIFLGWLTWHRQSATDSKAADAAARAAKVDAQESLIEDLRLEVADAAKRRRADWEEYQEARKADKELSRLNLARALEAERLLAAEAIANLNHRLEVECRKEIDILRDEYGRRITELEVALASRPPAA